MNINKCDKKNLIVLGSFAAAFSVVVGAGFMADDTIAKASAAAYDSAAVVTAVADNADVAASLVTDENEQETETITVDNKVNAADPQTEGFSVTEYAEPVTMYTSDTVNVRVGAGTDYDKVGKLSWGSTAQVVGETDNGWYEVAYNDGIAFILGDYMTSELPGVPYLFVGDSRTVQMEMAVGTSDKEYVAKVGEGYSWFKNTALSQIQEYAGNGTVMIINFGVNDLANASKYIKLVNEHVDEWINAGVTVYYAAVTPVGNCNSVSNAQIEKFNARLQSELDPRITWLDGYSYLQQAGFSTADGLHYNNDTYRSLYSYYMSVIET